MSPSSNLSEMNLLSDEDPLLDCGSFIDPNLIDIDPDLTLNQDSKIDEQTTQHQTFDAGDDTAQDQNQLTPEQQTAKHVDDTAQDQNQLTPEQQSVTHVDDTAHDQNQLASEPNQSPPQGETAAVQVTETANGKDQEDLALVKPKASASRTPNSGRAIPEGWTIEDKKRCNGATAGTVDKYYIDPVSGYKFRSKKEVFEFLDTGSTRKKRKAMENSDADPKNAGSSAKRKGTKKDSKPKEDVLEFDFSDIPKKVTWKLTDAPTNKWTPFLNDETEPVPEQTQKVWKAAYNYVMSQGSSSAKPEDSENTGLSDDETVKDD